MLPPKRHRSGLVRYLLITAGPSLFDSRTPIEVRDDSHLASRLEALNKELGTRLLVSSTTHSLLTGQYPLCANGTVLVKGKGGSISVYSIDETISAYVSDTATNDLSIKEK